MRRGRFASYVVAAVVVVALLEAALVRGELIVGGDLLQFFYPSWDAMSAAWSQGQLPRWNPCADAGASWFGPRAGGVVYPLNLLFPALGSARAFPWFLALHLLLACEGVRRLVDRRGPGSAALAAGLVYALGGYLIAMSHNPVYLVSAAWLPWAALGGALQGHRPFAGTALVGVTVAMCLLAGEPQGALMAAVVPVGFALSAPSTPACSLGDSARRRALFVGLGVALGLAAGALALLSALALIPESDRLLAAGGDTRFGFSPLALCLELAVPNVLGVPAVARGGYWGYSVVSGDGEFWCSLSVGTIGFVAVLASLLAPSGAVRARSQGGALVVVGLVLAALDAGAPLGLRFAAKWLVLSSLGLALLVGVGFPVLVRGRSRLPEVALAALAIGGLGLGLGLLGAGGGVEAWLQGQRPEHVVGRQARLAAAFALLRVGCVASLGLGLLRWGRGRSRRRVAALLLGLLVFDVLTAAKPLIRTTAAPVRGEPAVLSALRADSGADPIRLDPRMAFLPVRIRLDPDSPRDRQEVVELFRREVLQPNRGFSFGVRTVGAFESVRPRARALLEQSPGFARLSFAARMARLDARYTFMTRDDYMALSPRDRRPLTVLGPVAPQVDHLALVRNEACPPWASLVPSAVAATSLEEAVGITSAPGRDPRLQLVLGPEGAEAADPGPWTGPPTGPPTEGQVRVLAREPERIAFAVTTAAAAFLVVRDAYSPDWVASVDGAPTPISRADALFRAVRLPPGRHEVVFEYRPGWWTRGLVFTLLGWLALAGLGWKGWTASGGGS